MSRKKIIGDCRICGNNRILSFEHVPPRSAFNSRAVRVLSGEDVFLHRHDATKGRIQQRGSGAHTLCEGCNNVTGSWYGQSYAEWTYQGLGYMDHAHDAPSLFLAFRLFPLRVIKQIVCMFLSRNPPELRESFPHLVKFVLDRETKGLPAELSILCFLVDSPNSRQVGLAARSHLATGDVSVMSEISFTPYGYLLSLDSKAPDHRLVDISFFAQASYDEFREVHLRLPILPVETAYPADFRTSEQVKAESTGGISHLD